MSNPNNQHDVLAATDPNNPVLQRLRQLEEEVAQYRQSNVVNPPFAGEAPRYRLNEACFFDDTYIPEGNEIAYTDTPNLSMVPLNDPAKRAMEAYIEFLTSCQQEKEEGAGRVFRGLITDRGVMLAQGLQDARREARGPSVTMPTDKGTVPSMPNTDEARALAKRGPGRPPKVLTNRPPPPPARRPQPDQAGFVGPGHEPPTLSETG